MYRHGGAIGFELSWFGCTSMKRPPLVLALIAPLLLGAAPARPLIEGLDHTPIAVKDLDAAAVDFDKLGFVIKPGRPHDDGIRNKHVKFPNGGGIELITAASPTDLMAQDYVDWLKDGDGPAFWSVYSADLKALSAKLSELGLKPEPQSDVVSFPQTVMPHRLFFADRLRSPTDGPVYWAHPNTAYKLAGVWLAGAAAEARLLTALGAKRAEHSRCSPFGRAVTAYVLPGEGDEVMTAPHVRRAEARSFLGVTVLVKSLDTARKVLEANHVTYRSPKGCGDQSVWIGPADAHNLWIELYEPKVRTPT